MEIKKNNYLENFIQKNSPFNVYKTAAMVAEQTHDYETASYLYSKVGDIQKSYNMNKLHQANLKKDAKNKELSDKLRERISKK